jgi:hypothetical protein
MGYRVESYSLAELHRIAVPGGVAPSLFWVLPVGNWPREELDEVWRWFTESESECNDFGLLLVKEMGRRDAEHANVSLASVGGNLSDLVPAGAEQFVAPSPFRDEKARVFVLAGGYPQPGWGVVIEWPRGDIQRFENLVKLTTARLRDQESTKQLNVFKEAAQSFHRWQTSKAAPAEPNVSSLAKEIIAAEGVERLIDEGQAALQAGQHRLRHERVIAVVREVRHASWLGVEATTLREIEDLHQTLTSTAFILAVRADVIASDIAPKLDSLVADPSKREFAYQSLASQELKHALRACLHLRQQGIVGTDVNFSGWAEQTQTDVKPKLAAALSALRQAIEAKLVGHRGQKAQREHAHAIAVQQWRKRSAEARESFHLAAGRVVELQWELGPQFLVAFEHICRQDGLWVMSIPWDPARMVGWKIMAAQVRLDSRDLEIAARELAPGALGGSPTDGSTMALADGSYFTDYVHHIAISKVGFSPRALPVIY